MAEAAHLSGRPLYSFCSIRQMSYLHFAPWLVRRQLSVNFRTDHRALRVLDPASACCRSRWHSPERRPALA